MTLSNLPTIYPSQKDSTELIVYILAFPPGGLPTPSSRLRSVLILYAFILKGFPTMLLLLLALLLPPGFLPTAAPSVGPSSRIPASLSTSQKPWLLSSQLTAPPGLTSLSIKMPSVEPLPYSKPILDSPSPPTEKPEPVFSFIARAVWNSDYRLALLLKERYSTARNSLLFAMPMISRRPYWPMFARSVLSIRMI